MPSTTRIVRERERERDRERERERERETQNGIDSERAKRPLLAVDLGCLLQDYRIKP